MGFTHRPIAAIYGLFGFKFDRAICILPTKQSIKYQLIHLSSAALQVPRQQKMYKMLKNW